MANSAKHHLEVSRNILRKLVEQIPHGCMHVGPYLIESAREAVRDASAVLEPQPEHDCAQVERDCIELHAALAEAIRRILALGEALPVARFTREAMDEAISTRDLVDVLERTARPEDTPAARKAQHEPRLGDWAL